MVNENRTPSRSSPANPGAPQTILQGVKRQDWRVRPEAARDVGRKLAGRAEIAYWVVPPDGRRSVVERDEQRRGPRERTRLRSAKVLDGAYRFLCEGRICDRSRDGLRLALVRDMALPTQLAVHIDETSEIRGARVIWRRGSTIGIRTRRLRATGRDAPLRPVRAQRALLRDSRLRRPSPRKIRIPARRRRRRSGLARGGQAARGELLAALLILSATPGRLEGTAPARRFYWNSFRMSCAFWLAIDSDWMPSCSWVWSACNLVDAVFMSALTMPETPLA